MKVLHVIPSVARSYGGPTYALRAFAEAGARVGIESEIAAPVSTGEGELGLASDSGPFELRLFPGYGSGPYRVSPRLWSWLQKAGGSYDVIHIDALLNPVSSIAARICLRHGWPFVLRPCGMLSPYTFRHRRRLLKRAYFSAIDAPNIVHAAGLHFTTATEAQAATWHGIPLDGRSYVIPPPWVPPGNQSALGQASSRDSNNVLFLSRLDAKKNLEGLLKAWALLLRDRHQHLTLTVAGSGDSAYERRLHALAQSLHITDSVRFVGFASGNEKARLLADAAAFVLPSYDENFGVAVLEAIAAGIPVVISPDVQLASFVSEHRLGRVVARDPRELAQALGEVVDDDALRAHCAHHGPDAVRSDFSFERIGPQLRAMYEEISRRAALWSDSSLGTSAARMH